MAEALVVVGFLHARDVKEAKAPLELMLKAAADERLSEVHCLKSIIAADVRISGFQPLDLHWAPGVTWVDHVRTTEEHGERHLYAVG